MENIQILHVEWRFGLTPSLPNMYTLCFPLAEQCKAEEEEFV